MRAMLKIGRVFVVGLLSAFPLSIRQMHRASRRVFRAFNSSGYSLSTLSSSSIATLAQGSTEPLRPAGSSPILRTLAVPWTAIQRRGAKVLGSDDLGQDLGPDNGSIKLTWLTFITFPFFYVARNATFLYYCILLCFINLYILHQFDSLQVRIGNVIQRKGRTYQVLKAQHTQHGRGGATIQVELRDIDSGSKVTERFRTDEVLEEVLVEDKSLTVLYQDGNSVTLMDPSTFEQLEVPKDLFGKNSSYLKEEMNVTVQCYDGKPTSGSVPQRLTCTVVDAQPHTKGLTAAPQYKRVVLDNGLTVMVPPFIEAGDEIVLNTTEDKYLARAKE